ncbi:hypothetical protein OHU17_16620 [Streptomyces goshikiensis]|uniref:Uncharacterized protein n=1 Tax=Streptomyces goshikiensis TaxID=1942 RepID=A0ABZ1RKJ5_9ACTN|nr:hypothetical protein [Streptomyces goshikiensis]
MATAFPSMLDDLTELAELTDVSGLTDLVIEDLVATAWAPPRDTFVCWAEAPMGPRVLALPYAASAGLLAA